MKRTIIFNLGVLLFSGSASLSVCAAEEAPLVLSNEYFTVRWDPLSGGLESLVMNGDQDQMNWIEGTDSWGEVFGYTAHDEGRCGKFSFTGFKRIASGAVSSYMFGKTLQLEVVRRIGSDCIDESYSFKNVSKFPVYVKRGHLGVLATFNDSYTGADVCQRRRCHAHLWPYGECAYVHAKKMGPFETELALIVTRGALDGYSVRRIAAEYSNDRGDFVLHPAPFVLLPGESREFSWKTVAFRKGSFNETLIRNGSAVAVFENETIFPGEDFKITVTGADGKARRYVKKADRGTGEYSFWFDACGKKAFARGRSSPRFEDIVRRRVDFIVSKQQCTDKTSPLYGAYLIYDNEENSRYFDEVWCDHNACRERLGMGILIARFLSDRRDERVSKSLDLFEKFVLREFFDQRTGAVFNTIGRNPEFKRLYNAPWMITFFSEMYRLKKESRYLDWIEKMIFDYYAKGGSGFYPNGCTFADAIALLQSAGRDTSRIKDAVREHVCNLVSNGIIYPAHEVKFEQTIATVPVAILSDWCARVEPVAGIERSIRPMIDVLERFDGNQPDHRLNSLPIRHWDAMWFGKRRLYGDTHHYWSVLTGNAYLLYSRLTGDGRYLDKARRCFRNCLWQFFEDGSASCAYVHPFSVTMLDKDGTQLDRAYCGERFDAFANDQDYALYFILRSGVLTL